MRAELKAVGERLEALVRHPPTAASGWQRVAVPVLRWWGWRPELTTDATRELLQAAKARLAAPLPADVLPSFGRLPEPLPERLLAAAIEELESNLAHVERAALVLRVPPANYLGWLERVHAWLTSLCEEPALSAEARLRLAAGPRPSALATPLSFRSGEASANDGLGAVDVLMGAARDEAQRLDRRRRLLEAARRVLLEVAASVECDDDALRARREDIATGITEVNRLQAAGLSPDVALSYQLRRARRAGDSGRAYLALKAVDAFAHERGDVELALRSGPCVARLESEVQGAAQAKRAGAEVNAVASPCERAWADVATPAWRATLESAYAAERAEVQAKLASATMSDARDLRRRLNYLSEEGALRSALMALAADGYFDVGGSVSAVRVEEDLRARIELPYPTPQLKLSAARGPADVPHAVVEDPRLLLYHLATGRLLCRRYGGEEVVRRSTRGLMTQVRIYVLDGSASMIGARARMRDALALSELGALMTRLTSAETYVHTVLYYRYFNREAQPTRRVASVDEGLAAVRDILAMGSGGSTDIEGALLDSFEQVRAAQRDDAALAHAQIVLVTDGEAKVRADRVLEAQAQLSDVPIGVSVVALGDENQDLRSLAAQQRLRGEQVFYHHISDAELGQWEEGSADIGVPLLRLDPARDPDWLSMLTDELDVVEAAASGLQSHDEPDEGLYLSALEELGVASSEPGVEAARARHEAAREEAGALRRRFERWFPEVPVDATQVMPPPTDEDHAPLRSLLDLLSVVSEVAQLLGSSGSAAQLDAIDLAERLMLDAGLGYATYARLVREYAGVLRPALDAVRVSGLRGSG